MTGSAGHTARRNIAKNEGMQIVVNELLDTLEEQDYDTVIDFIQFLSNKRLKRIKRIPWSDRYVTFP